MGHFDDNEDKITGTGHTFSLRDRAYGRHQRKVYSPADYNNTLRTLWEDNLSHMHIERGGKHTPLYKLDLSHLLNIISFHARNLAEGIREHESLAGPESMLDAIMVGKEERMQDVDNIKTMISDGYAILGRYMVEAMRREKYIEALASARPYFDAVNSLAGMGIDRQPIKPFAIEEPTDE